MLSTVTIATLELAVELFHNAVPSTEPQACVTADPSRSRRRGNIIAKRERRTKRSPRPALSPSALQVAVTILVSCHCVAVTELQRRRCRTLLLPRLTKPPLEEERSPVLPLLLVSRI
ncbi:uncharacterized protein DS421_19g654770 [Arachis hypogaea]|uniref:Uncharacterized protein n=1 Tax=Arachis hypogaea TaxID=3818 RepID=A0A6B9V7G5_ARAHY|nr:uncharacterized protein DS421_19g654770 [Arachis hypogaea]